MAMGEWWASRCWMRTFECCGQKWSIPLVLSIPSTYKWFPVCLGCGESGQWCIDAFKAER